MIYRIKQFIWAITAKVSYEERQFVHKYLTSSEQELFNQLKVYEQKHSIAVAKGVANSYKGEDLEELIRIGLLHDIGKIVYPIGPIRKSIMVLLHKFTKGAMAKWHFMKMVRCYYDHAELGYKLLKKQGVYSPGFLEIIRDHHKPTEGMVNEKLRCIGEWDNKC